MVGKLNRLPAMTQQALQQLACLGNVAETGMLSIVLGMPEPQVHAALWPAVRQDLVERLAGCCKFMHDRVQEAAYSLIPEASRAEVHLRIGRLLVAQTPPEKREEAIFDVVTQLNRGAALIAAREERDQLAELNLIAGKRAKGSTAYAAALTYLNAGAGLLAKDGWERRRDLIFALELNRAECEFLTGGLAAAEERLNVLATRVATTIERAAVVCLLLDLYTTSGQSSRGVAVGLEYLRHLGVEWSPHPTDEDVRREYARFWSQLGSRTIEDLIELPLMTDPASLATMDVLTNIPSAFLREKNLYALAMCWAVNLSLERGNSDGSCATYVQFGCVIGMHFGDYESAYRFGRLGCALVERHGLNRFQARTYLAAGCHLIPYAKHVRIARDLLSRGFEIANKSGDLMYMGWYRGFYLIENLISAGDSLTEVQREAELGLAFAHKMQLGHVIDVIPSFLGLVRMLRGLTSKFGSFTDEQVNELRIEARLAGNPDFALAECLYYLRKLQAHFHAGDYAAAIQAASRAEKLHPPALLWMFTAADYRFYSALSQAGRCDFGPADERQQHLLALAAHHRQLQAWAQNCPENFENRAALVGAEMARLEGRAIDAELLYEQAIRSSRANGFIQNEALAYELASRFYGARGFEKIARVYLQDARYCYLRWGADGKVRQLEEIYPHLRSQASAPSSTGTIATSVEHLDLATVIKVSQAISGAIVLENLINMLMRTAIEQAGAERGLLILPRGGEQRMAAEAVTGGDTIHVQPRDLPVTAALLPESVLHYVVRTRESVILDDAATQPSFAADPYIRQHRARSILCLPLLNQAKLSGVLYLENNLAPRVFAPARIAVLKLLASQAAIALENAGLYRDLAEREAKIRRLVDANIVGIFSWDMEGLILEANDAFLRMVGYTREDVVSGRLRWTELTPPEWREIDEQQLLPAMRMSGHLPPFEKEYFRKDGSRVPVLIGVAAFQQGQSQGVAFALDLTERKRGEKALRAREAQIRRLVDANIIGVYVADLDGRIFEANDAFLRIVGYRREDLSSGRMHVMDMTPPEWRERTGRTMAEIKLGKTVQPYEKEYFRADGSRVPVLVGSTPFEESNLGVALGVVFVIDLTERKQVEAAARDSEQRYREVEMELAHANRVATMGQLTASIAHEVNQPIAATVTNAQAALRWLDARTPDLEEARQALARIVKDGNRAGDVVSRIRGLVSKAPPRKDRLQINGAIREVIELTRVEAMRKSVSVQLELAEGLPTIEGDRVGLQQVMLNLIVNAVEAMSGVPEGPRDLLVTSGTAGADRVLVAVRDSGPGLTPAALERLFDAFYTTKPTGLGLGLSICRSIIEAHDGRLWASANEPRGAIFQFTVPACLSVATESARAG
jgi:PAS domain S-box-containing protein